MARKFLFQKYKKFFQSGFFLFFELGKLLPEIWEVFRVSVSWNIRNFFGVSVSGNIRKFFRVGFLGKKLRAEAGKSAR